jgi:hypothetical protein
MKFNNWTIYYPNLRASEKFCQLGLLLLASAAFVAAQEVVSPPTAVDVEPGLLRQAATNNSSAPTAVGDTSPTVLQSGPFVFRPHLVYRYLYGDGLQSSPGVNATTSINSVAPGLAVDIGKVWSMDYTPTWTYYSNNQFSDTVDHFARLAGITAYDEWGFQLAQSYEHSSAPRVETGGQTKQDIFSSTATVTYQLGSRMLISEAIDYNVRLAEDFPDSREWLSTSALHYQFFSGFDTSVNVEFGRVNMSEGADMRLFRPQLEIAWQPSNKISLHLQGGLENRKFEGNPDNLYNPILSASLAYTPFSTTKVSLAVGHTVSASYFENQVTENTNWSVGFSQRFLERFQFSADFLHQDSDYVSTLNNVSATREDSFDSFDARLTTQVLRRFSVAVFYLQNHNSSNAAGFSFTSNQVGFELAFQY